MLQPEHFTSSLCADRSASASAATARGGIVEAGVVCMIEPFIPSIVDLCDTGGECVAHALELGGLVEEATCAETRGAPAVRFAAEVAEHIDIDLRCLLVHRAQHIEAAASRESEIEHDGMWTLGQDAVRRLLCNGGMADGGHARDCGKHRFEPRRH